MLFSFRVPLSPVSTGSTLTSSLAKGAVSSTPSGERVSAAAVPGGAAETSCLPAGFASEATRFIALMLSCLEVSRLHANVYCESAKTISKGVKRNPQVKLACSPLDNFLLIFSPFYLCNVVRSNAPAAKQESHSEVRGIYTISNQVKSVLVEACTLIGLNSSFRVIFPAMNIDCYWQACWLRRDSGATYLISTVKAETFNHKIVIFS